MAPKWRAAARSRGSALPLLLAGGSAGSRRERGAGQAYGPATAAAAPAAVACSPPSTLRLGSELLPGNAVQCSHFGKTPLACDHPSLQP